MDKRRSDSWTRGCDRIWQHRSNRRNVAVDVIAASLSGTMAAAAITATATAMSGSELAALMTINARQQYIPLAIDG